MARIRTIKPEFPHSESMGRVSRDARLCFIMMWTLADDSGRLRGNSRMLASLLFPYDDDAPNLIDKWIDELSAEGCLDCYKVDDHGFIQIRNWLNHQRIDKPTESKIPAFQESSRILANPREGSCLEGKGVDQGREDSSPDGLLVPGIAEDFIPRPPKPDCPHREIISLYHEILPMCPTIRDWTPARQTLLRTRWSEEKERQTLDYWREFFEYVAKCKFLVGQTQAMNGKPPFVASLPWLLKAENFAKVREGHYEPR